MPRGHEHISFVFLSAFWDIFSYSLGASVLPWEVCAESKPLV